MSSPRMLLKLTVLTSGFAISAASAATQPTPQSGVLGCTVEKGMSISKAANGEDVILTDKKGRLLSLIVQVQEMGDGNLELVPGSEITKYDPNGLLGDLPIVQFRFDRSKKLVLLAAGDAQKNGIAMALGHDNSDERRYFGSLTYIGSEAKQQRIGNDESRLAELMYPAKCILDFNDPQRKLFLMFSSAPAIMDMP